MKCLHCENDNTRDYPLCKSCERLRHFTNRTDCRCESCANPDCFPAAVRARFPNLVLVATSDDPPELARWEFTFDAIKPEYQQGIAKALCDLYRAA